MVHDLADEESSVLGTSMFEIPINSGSRKIRREDSPHPLSSENFEMELTN